MADEPRVSVSDQLLGPLIETAADTLRTLGADDVPASLRHLRGFDRRGLMHGPGPRQLRRAFEDDEAFREHVMERFSALQSVESVVAEWSTGDAWTVVEKAVRREDLPLLASVLWACAPPAAEFGLGLVVAFDAFERRDRGDADAARVRSRELGELEEARRRADAARLTAEADAARAAQELRQERRARRAREESAEAQARAASRRAEGLDAQVQQARTEVEEERARTAREAQRARALEDDLRRARAEIAELSATIERAPSRLDARDARALADATAAVQRLSAQLESLRARVETPSGAPTPVRNEPPGPVDKPLARRVNPPVPPGVLATSAAGIEAMLKCDGVLLVIDGYNVTKRAWPDATAADQRERLGIAVTQLQRRFGCGVLCVFDGDGSGPHPAIRRGAIRVLFSDAGEEADEVVVREVSALPKRVPVVVASSDAWIREHAQAAGAVVVPADAFLGVLRPPR
jgi:predicted RNA-binding protein with PIN domain